MRKAFMVKQKAFFIIFKLASLANNRPEGAPLTKRDKTALNKN